MTFPDPDRSFGEERYVIIGLSSANRILIVPHTDRADRVRIIKKLGLRPRASSTALINSGNLHNR